MYYSADRLTGTTDDLTTVQYSAKKPWIQDNVCCQTTRAAKEVPKECEKAP